MPEAIDPKIREERERSRWIGLAVVAAAALFAFVVTVGIFIPAIGVILERAGTQAVRDPATLPEQVLVCDREYARSSEPIPLTLAEVQARDGRDPTVVTGVPVPGCPDGTCVEGGMCLQVVYVSAGPDRYVTYDLQGGP